MRINGVWLPCDDQEIRPVIKADIQAQDASWLNIPLLVDVGADRSLLCATVFESLGYPAVRADVELGGIGGTIAPWTILTALRFLTDDGTAATIRGRLAATDDPKALDMSVLGRDILNLFAVIVDKPGDTVCLLGQRHRYRVEIT